jgi:hypothetical protein
MVTNYRETAFNEGTKMKKKKKTTYADEIQNRGNTGTYRVRSWCRGTEKKRQRAWLWRPFLKMKLRKRAEE